MPRNKQRSLDPSLDQEISPEPPFANLLAPPARHDPRLGRALLLQLLSGHGVPVEGMRHAVPGNMHVLLVAPQWSVEAPYLVRHVARVDPTRSLLYQGDELDEDTLRIRRSEGWRFRRRVRGGVITERLVVEGGIAPANLDTLMASEYGASDWLKALLSGVEHSPEDPRWGVSVSAVRGCVLSYTRSAELKARPRSIATALLDDEMAYGFLPAFDLVLPVANAPAAPGDGLPYLSDPFKDEDELASEDLRAWLGQQKQLPAPRVPQEVLEKLRKGLMRVALRWKKQGGEKARRLYGPRVEHALIRLTAASARAAGRDVAVAADAQEALRLMAWSWETIAHLRGA